MRVVVEGGVAGEEDDDDEDEGVEGCSSRFLLARWLLLQLGVRFDDDGGGGGERRRGGGGGGRGGGRGRGDRVAAFTASSRLRVSS